MNTLFDIADQLRACIFEHVRTVIEPDDAATLVAYLESQGFRPPVVESPDEVRVRFLKSKSLSEEQIAALSINEQGAIYKEFDRFAAQPFDASAKVEADEKSISAEAVEIRKHTPGSGPQEPMTKAQTDDAEAAKQVEVKKPRVRVRPPVK